jgi:hypothetical protein
MNCLDRPFDWRAGGIPATAATCRSSNRLFGWTQPRPYAPEKFDKSQVKAIFCRSRAGASRRSKSARICVGNGQADNRRFTGTIMTDIIAGPSHEAHRIWARDLKDPCTNPSSFGQPRHSNYAGYFRGDVSMVSTYLTYNSVVRNLKQSMTRVAQQPDVTRNAAYYKDNIGKVKTVDDLLNNDRLYQYAMKAYGLDDMAYAKAFMKKVLQSDLTDPNSFANKLTDKRYQEFAAAFSFSGAGTAIAQSTNQTDDMIGLYTATVTRQVDAIGEDTSYYNQTIGSVKSVDQLLNDDRLRTYVFDSFGIDDTQWSRDTMKKVLSSDPSDPNSYVNTVWVSRLGDINHSLDQARADISDANSKIASYMTQM